MGNVALRYRCGHKASRIYLSGHCRHQRQQKEKPDAWAGLVVVLALLMGQVHGALRERYQLFLLRKAWVYPFCTTSPG